MNRCTTALVAAALCVACGTSGDGPGEVGPGGDPSLFGQLSSDWHPDADGDGVTRADDVCPHVYNPDQSADACDPGANRPQNGGVVTDLIAEHVTPYGGWFSFSSPHTTDYGWDGWLLWSTVRSELSGSFQSVIARGDAASIEVDARFGDRVARPVIVTSLSPDTTYFVAVIRDGDPAPGNVVEIHTHPAPSVPSRPHPRVAATGELLSQTSVPAAQRAELEQVVASEAQDSGIESYKYCATAAVLAAATNSSSQRSAAESLLDSLIDYWESSDLSGNAYRWADAALGLCADLQWTGLSTSTRDRIARALLDTDERNLDIRIEDTDELAAAARTRLIDGLLLCDANGLDSALSARGCAILDSGLRLFYGVQLVKARRDRGVFAQSGGHLPDGIGYSQGTLAYWMQAFHALSNAGVDVDAYAPFVLYAALSNGVHALTPMRRGLATFGDLDQTANALEPNSLSLDHTSPNLFLLSAGLLSRFGDDESASWIRHHVDQLYQDSTRDDVWAALLYSGGAGADYTTELPTAFLDSGMGILYDRTSWSQDASFLTFRAGWSGVDHCHEDAGSFQLYRDGSWITHENLGYAGDAATVAGKNAPLLEVEFEDSSRPGQFVLSPTRRARITRASSGSAHAYMAADLVGAYTSHYHHSYGYDAVERHLMWLKPSAPGAADILAIYDVADSAGSPGTRAAQLQVGAPASVSGSSATASLAGSELAVHAVLPASASVSTAPPEGSPHQYPGEIYSHRVFVEPGHSDPALRLLWTVRAGSEPAPAPVAMAGDGFVGVRYGDVSAVFPEHGRGQTEAASASISIEGQGPLTLLWAGLAPNADYSVNVSGGRVELSPGGSHTADAGGVLELNVEP